METLPSDILRIIVEFLPEIYADIVRFVCKCYSLCIKHDKTGNIQDIAGYKELFHWAFYKGCKANPATLAYFSVMYDYREIVKLLAKNDLQCLATAFTRWNKLDLFKKVYDTSTGYLKEDILHRCIAIATKYNHVEFLEYFDSYSPWHFGRYHVFYDLDKDPNINWEEIYSGAIDGCNSELIGLIHSTVYDPLGDLWYIRDKYNFIFCKKAIISGNLNFVIFLEKIGYKFDERNYFHAAKHGHLHILDYLYKKYPKKDPALSAAIVANHIELFKLAYPSLYMSKKRCIKKAKNYKRTQILDYINAIPE